MNYLCTLPTDQLFNLEFQFKFVFNLEFQAEFGIQLGIPIRIGINLGECGTDENIFDVAWYAGRGGGTLDQSDSILKYNLMETQYRKSIHYTCFKHTLNGHKCGHSEYVTSMW